jgi:hypothetical protein
MTSAKNMTVEMLIESAKLYIAPMRAILNSDKIGNQLSIIESSNI